MRRSNGGLWMAVFLGLGCASPKLDVGPTHPASIEAAAAPLPPVGSALEPGFEPQPAALASGAVPAAAQHQHAAPATAPAAAEHQHAAPATAEKKAPPAATQWTCPMHPEIIRNEPGSCPICGMKLKPIPPEDGVKGSP